MSTICERLAETASKRMADIVEEKGGCVGGMTGHSFLNRMGLICWLHKERLAAIEARIATTSDLFDRLVASFATRSALLDDSIGDKTLAAELLIEFKRQSKILLDLYKQKRDILGEEI